MIRKEYLQKMIGRGGKKRLLLLTAVFLSAMILGTEAQAETPDVSGYAAVFDAEYYYNSNPDLAPLGMDYNNLLKHFIDYGMKEGRAGIPAFQVRDYMQNNLDLLSMFGIKDLSKYYMHYIQAGKEEGRIAVSAKMADNSTVLGTYTSQYLEEEDRAVNVKLAAERINGTVLQPGEEFSFSKAVLSRTKENGYVLAPSFAAGRVVKSIGGGICQISSNLYVSMLLSGMNVLERYPHSLPVDYVPKGLDSAIAEGAKDLRFRNPYEFPVRILASAVDGKATVSIEQVIE